MYKKNYGKQTIYQCFLTISKYMFFCWGINASFETSNRAKCTSRKTAGNASAFFERKMFERKNLYLHRLYFSSLLNSKLKHLISERYRNY